MYESSVAGILGMLLSPRLDQEEAVRVALQQLGVVAPDPVHHVDVAHLVIAGQPVW